MRTRGLLLALGLAACGDAPVPAGPDVIVLTVDTLRADRLGFAGHAGARTPTLDGLAGRGRVFTQATTPLPRTTPALASLLSGRHPAAHGSVEVGVPMAAGLPTLATRLQAEGWSTLALSGSAVAGPEVGLGAGFTTFDVLEDPAAGALTTRALERVAALPPGRPLLLWVHYVDPHFPYAAKPAASWRPEAPACARLAARVARKRLRRWRIFGDVGGIASAALADCGLAYDAEVAHVDEAIGALLAGLGPRAGGLVVLSADHGENMGEGGLWYEHGPDAHDASLRVPLVIAGPGVAPGTDTGVARLEDVAPTVLAALGLPPLADADGIDLLGPATSRPVAAVARSGSALHARLAVGVRAGRADERSCVHGPRHSLCGSTLYDRDQDPALRAAVADAGGEAAAARTRLAAAAARWPPEQTFQHTARSPAWKLVATPLLDGGYAESVYRVAGTGFAAPDPRTGPEAEAAAAGLRPLLPAAVRDGIAGGGAPAARDAETTDKLRALGYVE